MRKAELVGEIEFELAQLRQLVSAARQVLAVPPVQRRASDAAAAAKYVSDLFAGLENLCKRRYAYVGKPSPHGDDSHSVILQQFLDTPNLGRELPANSGRLLKKYMHFRHRFVHGYGFNVSWQIVEEPLRLLPDTVATLDGVWRAWLDTLPEE